MLERPLDLDDIFRTGNYTYWFNGHVILPSKYFDFFVKTEIATFLRKLRAILTEYHVRARLTESRINGNFVHQIKTESFQWIIENAPRPPKMPADILLEKMTQFDVPEARPHYDQIRKMIQQDIRSTGLLEKNL